MQTQKEFIKEQILRVAKAEFYKKGFRKTSVRDIATLMDATTGTIYTYFKSKDDLFLEIIAPAVLFAKERFKKVKNIEVFEHDLKLDYNFIKEKSYYLITPLIEHFRDELYLLFFKSSGSVAENLIEQIIHDKSIQYYENTLLLKEKGLILNLPVDLKFMRLPVLLLLDIIKEMIKSDMTTEELHNYEAKAYTFFCSAWRSIF